MSSLRPERSRSHLGLDGIIEINLVNGGVNGTAFGADIFQIGVRAAGQNFVNLAETQLRAQAAGDAHWELGFALGEVAEYVQGGINAVHGKAHGVRKIRIEQKEFRSTQR